MRIKLFLLSSILLIGFTYFSYTVAKERWQSFDFDITVKFQDRVPQTYDQLFSLLSLLGSAEVTVGICIIFASLALLRWKWGSILGWSMIVPATIVEIFGKLILFHPGPPVFFHRTTLATHLPSFYIHTDFAYPSGHMTRTVFIVTVLICVLLFKMQKKYLFRVSAIFLLIILAGMMGMTRIYLGEHWFSDVFGGALLGAGFGLFGSMLILESKKG